jgi:hypothetical protein
MKAAVRLMDNLVERLVGKFKNTPIQAFAMKEILEKLMAEAPEEKMAAQLVQKFIQETSQLPPSTIAYLLVPFVDDETRGRARVTIEKEGQDYRLHFDVATDALGLIESTVLMTKRGLAVEISSGSEDVVSFLKGHMEDLAASLEPYGVSSMEFVQKQPLSASRIDVDVLV